MIEVIVAERCISCDICIAVCPTDVFESGPDGLPVVAHQEDCQTCFMCEVNCPVDALYVAPYSAAVSEDSPHRDVDALTESGALGRYRAVVGWGRGRRAGAREDRNDLFAGRA